MLFTNLFFHPDARRPESVRLGALIFTQTAKGAYYYSHYLDENAIASARAKTDSAFLVSALDQLDAFLGRQLTSIRLAADTTEEQFAFKFIELLPHNMRVSALETWPPETYFELVDTFPNDGRIETRRLAETLASL